MKQKPNDSWNRLVAAARRAPEAAGTDEAPPGFATRVTALAWAQRRERSLGWLLERFAGRALLAAGALAVASVVVNLGPITRAIDRDVLAAQDPVTALLDLS